MALSCPTRALVRAPSNCFDRALSARPPETAIDVALAKRQHAVYAETLRSLGLDVTVLDTDERYPDGCFVEDCAVVAGGTALITRSGAPSRRGEAATVARALAPWVRLEPMEAPASLDGGDCLTSGRRIFVGESERTNRAGITRLEAVFSPLGFEIVPVPLRGVLHLKCLVSPLGEGAVLLAENAPFAAAFGTLATVSVPEVEAYAANCVVVGKTAIVAAGHPKTREKLAAVGWNVIPLDLSEFRKADGSITCLSILL